ncbi:sortase [Candidatus Saccharibacteria bacterium]|nr:sortase [Candidatus Saccharibacteria bacterium]
MELRKRWDWRKLFVILYCLVFATYMIVGLTGAEAAEFDVETGLYLPSIGLMANVTEMELKDRRLNTPDTIVGSFSENKNKTLLVGHSSTIFRNLNNIAVGDKLTYRGRLYRVTSTEVREKKDVNMAKILKAEKIDTLILMTCAGQDLGGGDASHRLIVEAVQD